MKPIRVPTHDELMKPLFKDKNFRKKIELGVKRLRIIIQIIELREKLGITQTELARRMGVSQPFIAKIENDEASNISLETLLKITDALNAEIQIDIRPKAA
ncbi:MAG TPA: helix-turn-helix transcriptional regulator [Candidatus Omnitrophota bacterium]|nr:helix-turn-helix transcriptional regulator [Candidatus Omnitrophota bacterium]